MRSARILFAAAATAGTLALAAPGAYAITAGDWDGSSPSQESDHGKPKGGMHTGSGALSLVSGDEWSKEHDKGDKSEKEHDKGDRYEKEHDKGDRYEKEHEKPKGGMHTGSGALSLVNADDWTKDTEKDKQEDWTKDTEKDKQKDWSKDTEKDEDGYKPEKPKGGMHTGGGGLASGTTNVTGAALVAGGLAAFVLHRRRKAAGAAA
ncbi:hypothetical protein [Streptomyces globisporus]|uniref:hypothetical protein n=1 Tax=Streptomyces globisporus TaxID=1908 RepID=UPI0004C87518|nr:hypothetical protein [Streptomyces globisporus]